MGVVAIVLWVLIAGFAARLKLRELEQRYGDRWTSDEPAGEHVHEDARDQLYGGPFRSASVPRVRQGFPRAVRARFAVALALAGIVGGVALWNAVAHYHSLGPEPDLRGLLPGRVHAIAARRDAARFSMTANGLLALFALLVPVWVERSASRERRPKERP